MEIKQPGDHDFKPLSLDIDDIEVIVAALKAANPDWRPVAPTTPTQVMEALKAIKNTPFGRRTT